MFFFLTTKMLPAVAGLMPIYLIAAGIGLLDNIWFMVIIYTAMNLPIAIWMLRSFLADVPPALFEAASIDGANLVQTLRRIIVPIISPGIAATALICFIFAWNELLFAKVLTGVVAQTAPVYLTGFVTSQGLFLAQALRGHHRRLPARPHRRIRRPGQAGPGPVPGSRQMSSTEPRSSHSAPPTLRSTCREDIPRPGYDRGQVTTGIVHFGVGGFHRAHQAMYLDRLMNEGKALDWGICGVGVMPFDATDETGDGRSRTACTRWSSRTPDGSWEPRVIGSIVEYLFAPDDPEAVIEKMADPATRIVSLTVTEGGYNFHQVTGEFDAENPAVAADLGPGAVPATTFGLITEALVRRRDRGLPPFTIMSCDNIQGNGARRPQGFTTFARLRGNAWGDDDLGDWVAEKVLFPNSHGRPDHPGHHRPGPGGHRRPVRHRRRLAGGLRAVHPVGAGGPLRAPGGRRSRTSGCSWSTTSNPTS